MGKNIPDSVSPGPADAIPEQDTSASGRLETGPLATPSPQAAKCEDPAPSTANGGKKPRKRKDHGHLHATRHAVLSRSPLEALQSLGEDIKKYRRIERGFREALKPIGQIALMIFDRFFSSYLRCVLAARIEARAVSPTTTSANSPSVVPLLREGDVPTLLVQNGPEDASIPASLPADLFHQLVLVQRYDRHFSREMYRALSFLLAMRNSGEDGLQQCIGLILGPSKQ